MTWRKHIHSEPETLDGKPVVRGTRLAIEFLLGLLAQGWSPEQLLDNFPRAYCHREFEGSGFQPCSDMPIGCARLASSLISEYHSAMSASPLTREDRKCDTSSNIAPIGRGALRVMFWGALAMAISAGVGRLFGTTL